jgi:circadian clock protein KaiC
MSILRGEGNEMQYTKSGNTCLDTILQGGIPQGSSIVIEGAPGTGKTTLAIQFLHYGATQEHEPGIYITFEELPDQIYQDMEQFGWHLKELEQQNLLRIICISPKLFIEQITKAGGLIEQVITELQCKRMVIDSVSLMRLESDDTASFRKTFYSLRNALRKFHITALLLQESMNSIHNEIPLENYVSDGVIRLSLKNHMENFRKRTLEVLKMRGTSIMEGEHHFKITNNGVHVVPSLSLIGDKILASGQLVSTGVPKMDQLLFGGIPKGTAFLVDTNSKANYIYFVTSIIAERLKAGHNVVSISSSLTTLQDLVVQYQMFDVDFMDVVRKQQFIIIEHFGRSYPEEILQSVIDVSNLDNDTYKKILADKLNPIMAPSYYRGENWFIYYDLNTMFSQRGVDFVNQVYAEEISRCRAYGLTILALCNFAEISPDLASYLERSSSGVIRTWVDGSYQYMQLAKSPHGVISEPLIVENIPQSPYINLL